MTEAKATIIIDGNTEQLAKKTEQGLATGAKKGTDAAKRGVREVGDEFVKAGDRAGKSMEASFNKSINVLARGMAIIGSIAQGINAATQKASELLEKSAQRSEKQGDVSLEASMAAVRGGFDQNIVNAFTSQIAPVSQSARVDLIESLAKSNPGMDNRRLISLTSAFASGGFSQAEIMDAAGSGAELDVQGRLSQLSPEARKEIEVRRSLDAIDARKRGGGGMGLGAAARLGPALNEASDINNPSLGKLRAFASGWDATGMGQHMAEIKGAIDGNAVYLKEINRKTRDKSTLNMTAAQDTQ